ncbi:uncharacterized protein [Rutidosis leptorrhynchoides]|uniref:uncharacterized protein n=1 Tax=Rutidosis leptorrhynchoides TaxID=125765 RepID=UPI003A99D6F1
MNVPILLDATDGIKWKGIDGIISDFSVAGAYEAMRPRTHVVSWFHVIWFSQCIPRHAFVAWLKMREKLRTHDKMMAWEIHNQTLLCPLCKGCSDSHSHLFFECNLSQEVWD